MGRASAATGCDLFPVNPFIYYTTTANLRFAWTGDPGPSGPFASRPQTFVNILYYTADQKPSVLRAMDTFRFFQADGTTGFATFPFRYSPPADASFVALQFGATRNGFPSPIKFDVANVR